MTQQLLSFADILPPGDAMQSSSVLNVALNWISDMPAVAVVPLLIALLVGRIWRQRSNPIAGIRRALKRGELSPREAAHRLAAFQPSEQLDKLRFQRVEPEVHAVLQLLKSDVEHE